MPQSQSNVEYSYYLEGFDKQWSEFSKKTEKDYTNLPYGNYVFRVKARNNFGQESAAAAYKFVILPPWYQTIYAYMAYAIMAICLVIWIYKRQQQKFRKQREAFEKEQERMRYLHQLELVQALGVKDSKQLTDDYMRKIAPDLMKACTHSILTLRNEKYNAIQARGHSQGKIKALLHNQALKHVLNKIALILFSTKNETMFCTSFTPYSDSVLKPCNPVTSKPWLLPK